MGITDITALGELLIDFTEYGVSENGRRLFEQNPGGAVCNVLAAAAKLGKSTAFIGKIGNDMHGKYLYDTLVSCGIDTQGLILEDDVFTTLAFVSLENGERSFSFARKPGADTCLRTDEVSSVLLINSRILHVGSLSLTDEPARSATMAAVKTARENGVVISYDPNYRASLWNDAEIAKTQMRALLPYVDIMKLSDDETELLTDLKAPEEAAKALCATGISCVCVTLGSKGAIVCVADDTRAVAPFAVDKVVDTTGAGDAFWGGFLSAYLDTGKAPDELSMEQAVKCALTGNAAASLCIQKRGSLCTMPEKAEVEALIKSR